MAAVVDQQSSLKHFCKICNKGFGCGRALGGHMRTHGMGLDENAHMDDEDPACSHWDDHKLAGGGNNNNSQPPGGNKRMYALRTNPRLKTCQNCEHCGKQFSSWNCILEHGKYCSSADAESLVSSPVGSEYEEEGMGNEATRRQDYANWSKGKRSRRAKLGNLISNCPSSEEEDLAHCLVMLSTARVDPLVAETEESCASASKEEERRHPVNTMLPSINRVYSSAEKAKGVANKGVFECKACKKVFNSHQALGGHRASHKKVKGCFAANLNDLDDSIVDEDVITNDELSIFSKSTATLQLEHASQSQLAIPVPKRKSKVHECSICHRIFSSGQALGGHKRCHWLTSNSPDTSSIARFHQFQDQGQVHLHQRPKLNKSEPLDLNLPAPVDDAARVRQDHENTLTFQVPTEIFLQPWTGTAHTNDENNNDNNNYNATTTTNNNNINSSMHSVDDEAESKVKLTKLSDLKDMNLGNGSSPWLQVGIGSTSNMGSDP